MKSRSEILFLYDIVTNCNERLQINAEIWTQLQKPACL